MSDEGATKVQNPAASDAQTIGIKGDSPRTRVRIPLGSPANSPAISATAAPVGAALPPQGGAPGANVDGIWSVRCRHCGHPRAWHRGHGLAPEIQSGRCAGCDEGGVWGCPGFAALAAPVAGSPLIVPALCAATGLPALEGCALAAPCPWDCCWFGDEHFPGCAGTQAAALVPVGCGHCESPRACFAAGRCFDPALPDELMTAYQRSEREVLRRMQGDSPEPLTLYAVRSTSEPGFVSIRVAPDDRTATPLYEALTRRFRAGDVLELRLVHRPRGGK